MLHHHLKLVFFVVLAIIFVFFATPASAKNDPVPTLATMNVYESSSTVLGSGTEICAGVSLTTASTCSGTIEHGKTYRFEADITVITASYEPTTHDFENSIGAGDVLGSIVLGDISAVGCVESSGNNNAGTASIESSVTARGSGYAGGAKCTMDTTTGGTVYWIITIDTDAVDGTADATFAVTNGTIADTSTLTTFNVAPASNSAPNVPTQDSPTNAATGVSVTPNFLMTATDPDTDNLGYKVTIYSNNACSTVVSTHDQAVVSTGWTGTDASCTAAPTSCYASGTQGDFVLQSGDALSNSTEYWWEAAAQDPDGGGTFTDSATCNSFTTVGSLTFVVSTDNFSALTPGTPVWATSTLSVDTDNSTGWRVTLSADNKSLTANVLNDGGSNEAPDPTNEWVAAAATTTAGNAATITFGDNFLYHRVMTASGSVPFISTSWWGSDDSPFTNAIWAGIASSTNVSNIGNSSADSGGAPVLNTVQFYLDVSETQITGTYTGGLTFTATMN